MELTTKIYEEERYLAPYSRWMKRLGIDVRPYWQVAEVRPTGIYDRRTDFYRLSLHRLRGYPANLESALKLAKSIQRQRQQRARKYMENNAAAFVDLVRVLSKVCPNMYFQEMYNGILNKAEPGEYIDPFSQEPSKSLDFSTNKDAIKEFLHDIHGIPDSLCTWRFIDRSGRNRNINLEGKSFSEIADDIPEYISKGRECFYSLRSVVSVGDQSRNSNFEYQKPRALFLDLDLKLTGFQGSAEMLEIANSICREKMIPYSHIVTTRNGYHLYWALSEEIDLEKWMTLSQELISLFRICGADQNLSQSQCPRLPFTYHWKGNSIPFPISFRRLNTSRYSPSEFESLLGICQQMPSATDVYIRNFSTTDKAVLSTSFPNSQRQESKDDRHRKIAEALNDARRDLGLICSFVGVPANRFGLFCCPYHNDNNPSAGITRLNSGFWFFNCFACEAKGDIIQLIKSQMSLSGKDLVMHALGLTNQEDLFEHSYDTSYLDENLDLLESHLLSYVDSYNHPTMDGSQSFLSQTPKPPTYSYSHPTMDTFQTSLPYIHPTPNWLKSFLADFFELAKRKIRNQENTFPASIPEIAGTKSKNQTANKLYLLRCSGLIEAANAPENLEKAQREYAKKEGHVNPTSWHHIPKWTRESLALGINRLKHAMESGLSTKSCTWNEVARLFGEDVANRVYLGKPKRRSLTPKNDFAPPENILSPWERKEDSKQDHGEKNDFQMNISA